MNAKNYQKKSQKDINIIELYLFIVQKDFALPHGKKQIGLIRKEAYRRFTLAWK